ncbi:MAG: hypothetical protein EA384_00540 [Spirochaetaceae bacterium]|nr:MAG: hypothetical protein EA384_00540 [Spirochaetaceae bacterium]
MLLVLGTVIIVLLPSACEQVFSTNIFAGLDRDPSRLTFEQQVNYARQAVKSGDRKKMARAYDALAKSLDDRSNTDPELNSLAATLALGASGLSALLSDFVKIANENNFGDDGALGAALNGKFGKVSYAYIAEAVRQIELTRDNGGTPSEQQYVFAAIGVIMRAGNDADGIQNVGNWSAEFGDLLTWFEDDYIDSDYLGQFQSL